MLIDQKHIAHWIRNFYGYGSWEAKFWFVGYDEPGGDLPEEVAEKLKYFFETHPEGRANSLCDIREVYKQVVYRDDGPKADVFTTQHEYRFGPKAIQSGIWKNLIAFVHGFNKTKQPDPLGYQKRSIALPKSKSEALIPLYPLPAPHNHSWYYSWIEAPEFPFLKSRNQYEAHVYQDRITTLLGKIGEYRPEVVLMYGMNNINSLKQSIQEFFPDVSFKSVKATKLEIPQHHRANIGNTKLIVTTQIPALRHNRVETGFDWDIFGKMIREY
jgi:hypothetical protein